MTESDNERLKAFQRNPYQLFVESCYSTVVQSHTIKKKKKLFLVYERLNDCIHCTNHTTFAVCTVSLSAHAG